MAFPSPRSGTAGPKKLVTGLTVDAATHQFVERSTFDPMSRPVAHTRWISYGWEKPMEFLWRSPSGRELRQTQLINPEWANSQGPYPGPLPMETGNWTLSVRDPADGKTLLSTQFDVTILAAPLPPLP